MSLWARTFPCEMGETLWAVQSSRVSWNFKYQVEKLINFCSHLQYLHGRSYRDITKQTSAEDWARCEGGTAAFCCSSRMSNLAELQRPLGEWSRSHKFKRGFKTCTWCFRGRERKISSLWFSGCWRSLKGRNNLNIPGGWKENLKDFFFLLGSYSF